ncbi:carboxypeptidase S1, partial [Amniculicola lignicola CBS 123094]
QFQLSSILLAAALGSLHLAAALQFPPPVTYDHVLKSPIDPNITISYKSPDPGTCTTVFPQQKQYSGYINLPPHTLAPYQQNYSINTFFWFFEARNSPETAPLTIWLNGGPGSSSMIGLFREAGPCEVVQLEDGSYGTQSSMWGWDRSSNVLFIDQPTQTGFSYDEAVNGSINLFSGDDTVPNYVSGTRTPWAFLDGTFPSGNSWGTQNTSLIAASASWHFLQGFLSAFPQYNPGVRPNSTSIEPAGINLFAESYGGQYGPAFAQYFTLQNARRATGQLPRNSTLEIKLTSLGIINGLVDSLIQVPSWPKFAYNNTYGIKAIDQTSELNYLSDFNAPGGCKDLTTRCRDSIAKNDPQGEGDEEDTNDICAEALTACNTILTGVIVEAGRSPYDITAELPDSYPNYAYLEYLNSADVLRSIGAKVNYTESNSHVFEVYADSNLLSIGVRVAFLYGDSDLICNWYGGQDVSLEVARTLPTYANNFPAAGYADIIVNSSYVGGQVRQYGNLSFSRIYDAGHTIPSYQPETAFTMFTRIIQGKDIGTGNIIDPSTFGTKGPSFSDHRNKVPKERKDVCWIRAISDTCTSEQINKMAAGQGVVKNGIWYENEAQFHPPSTTVLAGKPGSLPTTAPTGTQPADGPTTTSLIPLTGVYTATGTPTPSSGASSVRFRLQGRQAHSVFYMLQDQVPRERSGLAPGLFAGIVAAAFVVPFLLA